MRSFEVQPAFPRSVLSSPESSMDIEKATTNSASTAFSLPTTFPPTTPTTTIATSIVPSDPFGTESDDATSVKYRTMTWWQCGMIMIAETISLGILSLPSVFATVGIVPGVLLILFLGATATYTGFVLGQFKLRHPSIHSMADAGFILFSSTRYAPLAREIFGAAQMTFLVFVMGSHILIFSIMLNTLSSHRTCTLLFSLAGSILSLLCALPRTLKRVSYLAFLSFASIVGAVAITMAASAHETHHPALSLTTNVGLYQGFLSVTNIIFAYAGHVAFFGFMSELRKPEEYTKALYLLQGVDTAMYLLVALICYIYTGPRVASPALSSTSPMVQKIAYGVAIPTIVVSGVINGHVAAKYVYVRLFRGTDKMGSASWGTRASWVGIVVVLWVMAWVIAGAIPVFNDLLGVISALFASWFTYGLSGVFWLFMNWGAYTKTRRKVVLTGVNVVVFLFGGVICVLGLWSSISSIREHAADAGKPFSCADNRAEKIVTEVG